MTYELEIYVDHFNRKYWLHSSSGVFYVEKEQRKSLTYYCTMQNVAVFDHRVFTLVKNILPVGYERSN